MSDSAYDTSKIIEALSVSPTAAAITTGLVGTGSLVLLTWNSQRVFFILQNLGGKLYVKLGLGAGTAVGSYSFSMDTGQTVCIDKWSGPVSATRDYSADNVVITEVS